MKRCKACGAPIPAYSGPGRPRQFCGACSEKSTAGRRWREEHQAEVAAYNEQRRAKYIGVKRSDRTRICHRCQRPFLCPANVLQWVCDQCQLAATRVRSRQANHVRRVKTKAGAEITNADIRRILASRTYCPLCRKKMNDKLSDPRQRQLDHIVPLNAGGTHSLTNIRVICRSCNMARPKDGGDIVQESLWARII